MENLLYRMYKENNRTFKLDHLQKYLEEKSPEIQSGFEINPIPDSSQYSVEKSGKFVCKVEFVNKKNEEFEEMETASNHPDQYDVYMTKVRDNKLTREFEKKLAGMGFRDIKIFNRKI